MQPASIRSLLFVPGDDESKMLKALSSEADALIFDLEDGVAPEKKARARELTRDLLGSVDRRGKAVFVRVNALDTDLTLDDLAAVIRGRPEGVVLPKCSGPRELQCVSRYVDALEARDGVERRSTRIVSVATESAAATLNLGHHTDEIGSRLWGLLWGGEDLSAALGAMSNRDSAGNYTFPYQFARSQCLYAANALGVVAVDAVFTNFRDPEGLEKETSEALRDGFTAKAAIHPAQLSIINRVMTPTAPQLEWARRVTELLADAAIARLDGKMIDLAHKRIAVRLLQRAAAPSG